MSAKPLSRALRRCLSRMGRDIIDRKSYGSLTDENAEVRAILDRCWRDGMIGVIISGMDCDCTQYYRESVMHCPNSVQWFKRHWAEHCDSLDGPESQSFVPPDEIVPQHRSYDLAMEAYENGHPSTVYLKSVDELVERN